MTSSAANHIRKERSRLTKAFESAACPARDAPEAIVRLMSHEAVRIMVPEEFDEWALECVDWERTPLLKRVISDHESPVSRSKEALRGMARNETDRLEHELIYGAALDDLRTAARNHIRFGERVQAEGLDRFQLSQLGTVCRMEINRDTRVACMWEAENRGEIEKMITTGSGATTCRGFHAQWKKAGEAQADPEHQPRNYASESAATVVLSDTQPITPESKVTTLTIKPSRIVLP
jgi:hypothetical protein